MPVTAARHSRVQVEKRFLTPDETAESLGLTTGELERLRRSGTGPMYIALTQRTIRYFADGVTRWRQRVG